MPAIFSSITNLLSLVKWSIWIWVLTSQSSQVRKNQETPLENLKLSGDDIYIYVYTHIFVIYTYGYTAIEISLEGIDISRALLEVMCASTENGWIYTSVKHWWKHGRTAYYVKY